MSFSKKIFQALDLLKKFNYKQIYFNPKIKTESPKIRNIFRELFEKYYDDLTTRNTDSAIYTHYLNKMSEYYNNNTDEKRKVIDFIAGMTDDYFNNQFNELFVPQSYGYFIKK